MDLTETITTTLAQASVDARTIERHPRSTIVPVSLRPASGAGVSVDRRIELLELIGEGGMGMVRRGTQHALQREVAIKGLKPEHKNDRAAFKLVREARVTGGLEHPNIIPVYEIAEEPDGTPLIVLKKVEGVDWGSVMHDPATVRKRFGADDLLEWNLRILLQVCNAVSFAHSRRVLHRDLKPENVMIGAFGEVYLLDWGIAVGLDGTSERLPLASQSVEMAGTPVYMAPEMLGGKVSRLSERTDVYLLGAILYEIVAGQPPHAATVFTEIIQSIVESKPPLPADVPAELARILRRALDADPNARFERADQLRLALEAFLRHRSAGELARHAQERLALLLERLDDPAHLDTEEIYRLYGECRFGLRHALEVWPQNDEIRASLELATTKMVELELRANDPQAARVLLRDFDSVPPALEAQVAEAQERSTREYGELRRLRDDLDPQRAGGMRRVLFAVVCAIWVFWPLLVEVAHSSDHRLFGPESAAVVSVVVLLAVLGIIARHRETLLASAINRRLGFAVVLAGALHVIWHVAASWSERPMMIGVHERLMSAAAIMAMLAASVHWGLLVSAGAYLVAHAIVAFVGEEWGLYATSASNLIVFVNLFALWSRRSASRGGASTPP